MSASNERTDALSTRELCELFERGLLAGAPFSHRDHVRVAWHLLMRYPVEAALDRMTRGIATLAEQNGVLNLFHATITSFYVLEIAARLARCEDGRAADDFRAFARKHPDLLAPSREFLRRFYSPEILDSTRARREFVPPDRNPDRRLRLGSPEVTGSSSSSDGTPW